jgi:hypothetical protein
MGITNFIGKQIAQSATSLITGATDVIVGTAGGIAETATSKIIDVSNIIHKSKVEKSSLNMKSAEEKLIKLKSLFDSGILNQNEFEDEKAKILKDM